MSVAISTNARIILEKRYLSKGESIEGMFRRVAGGNENYYNLMAELRFLPNSPTLFNMGLKNGCTSSACFVFNVADTMFDSPRSIVNTRNKAIAVAKAGGGVGYYFGEIRRKNSEIKSVHRKACGPVAVLRDYHGVRQLITQGGKRDLAQMGVLPVWHDDIKEFIHCKDEDPKSLESFNISVGWTDEWVSRAKNGDSVACNLWDEQCQSAWHHGCPGMFFPDVVNKFNPNIHLGLINAPNPCGETPNRDSEPCNLGSLSLPRYFNKAERSILWDMLGGDVKIATNFLDDILDRNEFPHPDITAASLLTRKLGLGVMGWADLLALMHIHYDTKEAVKLAEDLMKFINEHAMNASMKLAKEKGPYKGYSDKTQQELCRNETRTSIAPTGTIAIIADVSSSIEPHFALESERTTNEGIKLQERISCWNDLDGFIPKTAREIAPEWHIRHQAAFQKYTNLGVSKTVNLSNNATKKDISKCYHLMYDLGCKGGTVFRDGCRDEQVLVDKKKKSVYSQGVYLPKRKRLPDERDSKTHKFSVGGIKGYVTVSIFEDNLPGEIFLRVSKQGSTVDGMFDTWAMAFSNALQWGTPLIDLVRLHKGTIFEPNGLSINKEIPVCTSIPDYIVRWLELKFLKKEIENREYKSGQLCPDCGTETISLAGCLSCPKADCGWNRCG